MSLKLVPFESLGAVSYSLSIVTVAASLAISGIFSVKKLRDLGNQVVQGIKVVENGTVRLSIGRPLQI